MGFKEKLEVLVDADVKGFVRGMEQAGQSADRNLGKTDDRLLKSAGKMQSWGAAAFGASAVAAVGLGKMASLAAEAEVAQAKLDNSIRNSSQSFKNNGAALVEQANSLQKLTASDDEAIKGAQAILIQFGLTEGQVKTLTPLVNDLSRKMGIDLPAAAKAVGKATQGNAGILGRYGILLDKNALAADGFGATVKGLQSRVGGFATAEGRTFAGQLEIIKNQLSELGEGVGRGVTTTLSDLVGGLVDVTGALNDVDPGLQAAVGSFATIASVGVGVVGAVSFAAGSFIKLRESLVGTEGLLKSAEGGLSGFGKVAAVAGGAVAGAAIVGGIIEIGNAWNKASQDAAKFEEALAVLSGGKAGNAAQATASGINALTGTLDSFSETVDGLSGTQRALAAGATLGLSELYRGYNEIFGNDSGLRANIGGFTADLNQLGEFTDKLGETGNLTAMQTALAQLTDARKNDKNLTSESKDVLDENIGKLKQTTKATLETAAAQRSAEAATAADVKAKREAGIANSEYAATGDDVKESLAELDKAIAGATAAYTTGQAAAKGWSEAVAAGSGLLNGQLDAAQQVGSSFKSLNESIGSLPKSYDLLAASAGQYSDNQNKALDSLQAVGQAVQGQIGSLLASGASYDQVRAAAGNYEGQLRKLLSQQGINGTAQEEYIKLLGLTPDQVNTDITISGAEQARQQLQLLQGDFDSLPEKKRSEIYARIAQNDWVGALQVYREFKDKSTNVNATTTGVGNWISAKSIFDSFRDKTITVTGNLRGRAWDGSALPTSANPPLQPKTGNPFGTATGGRRNAGQVLLVGEQGPEVWVPDNSGVMIPNHKLKSGGVGGGGTTNVYNLTFQGPVTDEQWVIDAISKANRRGMTSLAP